ncbi:MAG: DUF4238 domain-containing protein [Novosphingobium sp.]|nr:DUF4238 domain-containing protein [Novosphingobium sp.]MCP5404309.1 DUF4238 domain-containing protein [Novosphingobium sp.]
MADPKKHHYNPRYYLERFESDDGQLWRLDKETAKVIQGSAKSLGYKKYWNRLKEPPQEINANWIEYRISDIDGASAKVISGIVERDPPESIAPLAAAISFMQNHQPRLKRELQLQHRDRVANWSDDYFLIVGVWTALKNWREYIPATYAVLTLPDDRPEWRFLTSSNPLISYANKPRMLLPISSRHCLLLNNGSDLVPFGSGYMQLKGEEMLIGINRHTVENSWQYVYSCRPDFAPL